MTQKKGGINPILASFDMFEIIPSCEKLGPSSTRRKHFRIPPNGPPKLVTLGIYSRISNPSGNGALTFSTTSQNST